MHFVAFSPWCPLRKMIHGGPVRGVPYFIFQKIITSMYHLSNNKYNNPACVTGPNISYIKNGTLRSCISENKKANISYIKKIIPPIYIK